VVNFTRSNKPVTWSSRVNRGPTAYLQAQLNLPISFKNKFLIIAKSRRALATRGQVLWEVLAFERPRYDVLAALHAAVAEPREGERAPFTGNDRIQDPQATDSSNVVQDSMNL
jgi:hypothetical protein